MKVKQKGSFCVLSPGADTSIMDMADMMAEKLQSLRTEGHIKICVDLSRSPVIDSRVIGALASCHKELKKTGGELVILSARNVVLEALLRTHMNRLMRFVNSEAEL